MFCTPDIVLLTQCWAPPSARRTSPRHRWRGSPRCQCCDTSGYSQYDSCDSLYDSLPCGDSQSGNQNGPLSTQPRVSTLMGNNSVTSSNRLTGLEDLCETGHYWTRRFIWNRTVDIKAKWVVVKLRAKPPTLEGRAYNKIQWFTHQIPAFSPSKV